MRIGIAREIKDGECRVAITPEGVRSLAGEGHDVIVARGAGDAVGFDDSAYRQAGARVAPAADIYGCELIVKVKELQSSEWPLLAERSTLFGFAQFNRDPALLDVVLRARVRVLAFEAVKDADAALPILAPMSRIAGRLAPFVAQEVLCASHGSGVLMTGVDAVPGARVVVIGAGNVGSHAALVAAAMGSRVEVYSRGATRLDALLARAPANLAGHRLQPGTTQLADAIADADVVIGAVLEPGRLSPKLLSRSMLSRMRRGSVLVDVGIDQGGIAESSRMTTLSAPTYVDEGVVHFCVPNLPARVARTATMALADAVLPYVRKMAARGIAQALCEDSGLAAAAMTWDGEIVHSGLARDLGRQHVAAAWRSGNACVRA